MSDEAKLLAFGVLTLLAIVGCTMYPTVRYWDYHEQLRKRGYVMVVKPQEYTPFKVGEEQ